MMPKKKLLILCTGNSCRSQMAEGLARHTFGDQLEIYSAGLAPADAVNPYAIKAMAAMDIDISGHEPKPIDAVNHIDFDLAIIVCDKPEHVDTSQLSAKKWAYWAFEDPADVEGNDVEVLAAYVFTRDQIVHMFRHELEVWLETI